MANLKLVGAVAIKVRPDAKDFRRETDREVDKQLAGMEKKVKVTAKVEADTKKAEADVERAAEEIEKKSLTLKVGIDTESVVRAQAQLEEAIKRLGDEKIVINFDDQGSIDAAQARLDEMKENSRVDIEFVPDEKGFREVLARIEKLKRDLQIKEVIDIDWDEASLDATTAEIQARLNAFKPHETITVSYNNNRESLERAIAQIKAEQDKIDSVKFDVELDPDELAAKRALLELILAGTPVELKVNYDDQGSLKAARARLQAMLVEFGEVPLKVDFNEAAVRAELAKLDALIKGEGAHEVNIRPAIDGVRYAKGAAMIAALTKNQVVRIFTRVDTGSLLFAAAKLTGLRAASRWTEEFGRSLGRLDRNLPIVAAVVLALSTLTSGVLSLTANVFSLGNGLGEVIRMAALLGPALLLGVGAVMTVFTGVFKDFGAAVNGDQKAINKLTASGKKAAAEIRVSFQDIREVISKNFWDKAGDSMLRFTRTAMPEVRDGLAKLSTSLGGIFSGVLDSFSRLAGQDGIKVFFGNLTRGFDVAQTGMASFMSGFNTLAVVGSTVFPRMGRAFEEWATKFDSWVQRLAADGTLTQWINKGIQGLKDLFNAGVSLTKVWANIGQSAQAAGAVTLHSFARMMDGLERTTAGERFQRNMTNIFKGAREASNSFHDALDGLAPAMDVFSITIKKTLSGAGKALGAFIAAIGDVMANSKLEVGMTAFLTGITDMFDALRPAALDVAEILQTFGQILGTVARDSGPLFRNLFAQLATVLTTAWHALEGFLPALVQLGTNVVNVLGPAFADIAGSAIPAFASAVQKLGEGLMPLIRLFADFAVGATRLVASMPLPVIAGLATSIITLGTSMKIAAIAVPLLATGLEAFGIVAGITAARVQLMIPVVGLFLAALTGGVAAAITGLATAQRDAAPFANEYESALLADARAAAELGHAVDDATKKTTIHKLAESGAYESAERLGISNRQLTEAVINGGAAYDFVKGKIDAAKGSLTNARKETTLNLAAQDKWNMKIKDAPTKEMGELSAEADKLTGHLNDNRNSYVEGEKTVNSYAEGLKALGIEINDSANGQKNLAAESEKSRRAMGEAAAATTVLADTFSSGTAKVDAMRKSLELLVGPNAKQEAAESLGAYAKGFQDLRDLVIPLKGDLEKLGAAAYGETGFLNVASGNKAVLQVNQALVDQVNNTWLGAKTAYDNAIQQGKTAEEAFKIAKNFIDEHKKDYVTLATDSGVASEKVLGQWNAVFGKEWVLKVTFSGATEAAAKAQAMVTALKGKFDGQKFMMWLDANPDMALLAITDADAAARAFVTKEWKARFDAVPDKAKEKIRQLVEEAGLKWNDGDFVTILEVAKKIPGLTEALLAINNGAKADYEAIIYAIANGVSLDLARRQINALAARRTAVIDVVVNQLNTPSFVARGGQRVVAANGGIMDGFGRGLRGFSPKFFANGGIERHVAQITKPGGPVRIWSEPETRGEAYVPYAMSKRPRSVKILSKVAKDFGYTLNKATNSYADGGTVGTALPSRTSNTSVTVGVLNTVDPDAAVKKLRELQQDALAVSGIN